MSLPVLLLLLQLVMMMMSGSAVDASMVVVAAENTTHSNPFWPHYPTTGGSQRRLTRLDGTWQFGFSATADPLTVTPSQVKPETD